MDQFLQQLVNGLSIGAIYALMAVGYSLVYSIMNFSNFAHGSVIMLGAYFGFFALTLLGVPFGVAFFIAACASAGVAVILERLAYKPLRDRRAPFLYFIITAMGASIFIDNSVIATIGPTPKTFPPDRLPAFFQGDPFEWGPLSVGRVDIAIFVVAVICLALLVLFIDFTKLGKAIQATAYNHEGRGPDGHQPGLRHHPGVRHRRRPGRGRGRPLRDEVPGVPPDERHHAEVVHRRRVRRAGQPARAPCWVRCSWP